MELNELAERQFYDNLLAGILRQVIQDYISCKRLKIQKRKVAQRFNIDNRIRSCERFFQDPPYDYGDIDFRLVQRLCDEKALAGGRVNYRDFGNYR